MGVEAPATSHSLPPWAGTMGNPLGWVGAADPEYEPPLNPGLRAVRDAQDRLVSRGITQATPQQEYRVVHPKVPILRVSQHASLPAISCPHPPPDTTGVATDTARPSRGGASVPFRARSVVGQR